MRPISTRASSAVQSAGAAGRTAPDCTRLPAVTWHLNRAVTDQDEAGRCRVGQQQRARQCASPCADQGEGEDAAGQLDRCRCQPERPCGQAAVPGDVLHGPAPRSTARPCRPAAQYGLTVAYATARTAVVYAAATPIACRLLTLQGSPPTRQTGRGVADTGAGITRPSRGGCSHPVSGSLPAMEPSAGADGVIARW